MEKWHEAGNITKSLSLVFVFSGVLFLYLSLTSPGEVAVSDTGEVRGIKNVVREFLQGKNFWKDQLFFIDKEIKNSISNYEKLSKIVTDADKIVEEKLEKVYTENPALRPSPDSQRANELRKKADQIEAGEGLQLFGVIMYQRILELRKIRPIVESKAR